MLTLPGLTEASDKVWTLDEYVEWLNEKLAGEHDVTFVGHSNGGRIGIAYAAKYHEKIKHLILEDSAGIVHNELPLRLKRTIFGTIAKVGKPLAIIPGVRKVFYKAIGARDYERAPEHMRKTMSNLITIDLRDQFKNITAPTLIIWGRQDTSTPLSDAFIMHNAMKDSKLVILDDAKHSPHKTHPERVADEIGLWLTK